MRGMIAVFILGSLASVGGCGASPPPGPARAHRFADTALTDFAFARGAPVSGVRLTACGRVTLSTTNTERYGATSFRAHSARPAAPKESSLVKFEFDRRVTAFDLTIVGLAAGDTLGDFNVGSPPRLSGNLIQTADGRVTTAAAVGGGTLSWPVLDVSHIELGARGATAVFERFGIRCPAVPDAPR